MMDVSILTRPEGRVLPQPHQQHQRLDRVSILTRPEGRVLQQGPRLSVLEQMFQSSPGPKAECYRSSAGRSARRSSFNPHPARRPSATRAGHLDRAEGEM